MYVTHFGIPCTYCGFQNENHNGAKYHNSSLPKASSRRSNRQHLYYRREVPYLIDGHDFTAGFLDFAGLFQEVPETGLCDLGVWCKDAHSVEFWDGIGVSWKFTSNDLVLVKTRGGGDGRHVCCGCWWTGRTRCNFWSTGFGDDVVTVFRLGLGFALSTKLRLIIYRQEYWLNFQDRHLSGILSEMRGIAVITHTCSCLNTVFWTVVIKYRNCNSSLYLIFLSLYESDKSLPWPITARLYPRKFKESMRYETMNNDIVASELLESEIFGFKTDPSTFLLLAMK
jgi:hypothetical protein